MPRIFTFNKSVIKPFPGWISRSLLLALPLIAHSAFANSTNAKARVQVLGLTPAETQAPTRRTPLQVGRQPNDPLYSKQWNLHSSASAVGAGNLYALLELKQSPRNIIAVVDSGVMLSHEDLDFLPGYDFVSTAEVANDGDGRDPDPTDPGDWVAVALPDCPPQPSSWHGTRVAGIIGAATSNHIGIAAANNQIALLPVRVTGTCGGYVQDMIDGLRWAAGIRVTGVPDNPHPASVINISLGFAGRCPSELQRAIDEVTQIGAIVVTASTNSGADLDEFPYAPASCQRVLTAGAATRNGKRAAYSAFGSAVDVLAPGGDSGTGILTTDNIGRSTAEAGSHYASHYGTSLAGAHLSATVAALKAESSTLEFAQISALIRSSATPLGQAAGCGLLDCGGGLLNAAAALQLLAGVSLDDLPVSPQIPVAAASGQRIGAGSAPLLALPLLLLMLVRRQHRCRTTQ